MEFVAGPLNECEAGAVGYVAVAGAALRFPTGSGAAGRYGTVLDTDGLGIVDTGSGAEDFGDGGASDAVAAVEAWISLTSSFPDRFRFVVSTVEVTKAKPSDWGSADLVSSLDIGGDLSLVSAADAAAFDLDSSCMRL